MPCPSTQADGRDLRAIPADDTALECRGRTRRRARWRIRLRSFEHGRVLPAIVPGAPSAPGECSVLPRAGTGRAGWISRLPALPAQIVERQHAVGGVKAICRFIEQHLDEPLTLDRLGKEFHQSPFHLQRRFKAVLGITPREYADSCRLRLLKRNLQAGDSVTRAMYDAGYGSSSRLYERTASQLGMTPDKYRRGAIAAAIRYTCADSPLGRMLIAATERGICSIQFARSDGELMEGLKREFPFAARKPDEGGLQSWVGALLEHMRGKDLDSSLPLDIRATAFQRRVWTYLQSIPFGATRSYSQVAKAIGRPSAARAVARACATNPVAVAIPCHRVVREDGSMGGYRWGIERKKALLEMEQKEL